MIGTTVRWKIKAGHKAHERTGTVLAVVPPGVPGTVIVDRLLAQGSYHITNMRLDDTKGVAARVRDVESYIVQSGMCSRQPMLYWPRPAKLEFIVHGG